MLRSALAAMILILGAGAQPARAQLNLLAGGGWTVPRGDSTGFVRNGLTGGAGVEWEIGPNLGIAAEGSWTRYEADAAKRRAASGWPASDPYQAATTIYDLTLAPKLYLMNVDIAAYVAFGGGPRWIRREVTAPVTGAHATRGEQAWGVFAGFGADLAFSEGFRVGFAPAYRRIAAERGALEYMTFTFYLKI